MATSAWDPAQYEKFRNERSRPFLDLLALVQPRPDMRVIDLGCGTGELTQILHRRLGARATVGVDTAPSMLARSAAFEGDGLRFERRDIAAISDEGRYDLVFSNAALQWLPDHDTLLRRLTTMLADGGQLAIQMPANYDHPSHTVAVDVAREEPFRTAVDGYARESTVLPPEAYAIILDRLGYREQSVGLHVYPHHLASRDDVVEWVRGTLLTDYQQRMSPDMYARYLDRYRQRLLPLLDDARPYFYPFKRILVWASR